MHHNFLFDPDQTLLDFHASEHIALAIVLRNHGLSFSDEIYRSFKAYNKSLWLELEKGTITRTELATRRFHVETVVLMSRVKEWPAKKCRIYGLFGHIAVSAGERN